MILETAKSLLKEFGGLCVYRMGADLDGNPIGCDCSAFVARCCGQRKFDGRLWWNTDRIYGDAKAGHHVRFEQIPVPVPGCIGVYPGVMIHGVRRAGHVFVVDDPRVGRIIDCSSTGHGIGTQLRSAWFRAGALRNGKPIIWAKFVGVK